MDLRNKTITIFGLGKSGLESALLLDSLNEDIKIKITDVKDDPGIRENLNKLPSHVKSEIGNHSESFIEDSDLIILSPGIRSDIQVLLWAKKKGIKIIGEIELAFQLCPAPIIAITGSNGKTTVTTLASEVLKFSERIVHLCGNIGNPFIKEIPKIKKDDLVCLEVSSFQLETIEQFKPRVAVFLNFSQNHLDRYANMQEYLSAKTRLFENQDDHDWAVLNYEDETVRNLSSSLKSQVSFFNKDEEEKQNKDFNSNHLAVFALAEIFGIKKKYCLDVFSNFKGIEHRLESVRELDSVEFINDSKSTTIESAIWALNNIKKPIIMIAGGKDKGSDFSLVRDLIKEKVKELILIGAAKDKIKSAMDKSLKIKEARNLKEAIKLARKDSSRGDCVLLSPMCASFDMFSNFEERGKVFKDIVKSL